MLATNPFFYKRMDLLLFANIAFISNNKEISTFNMLFLTILRLFTTRLNVRDFLLGDYEEVLKALFAKPIAIASANRKPQSDFLIHRADSRRS